MIVVNATDRVFLTALADAAHEEEDVVFERRLAVEALETGFPRLLVTLEGGGAHLPTELWPHVPELVLTRSTTPAWAVRGSGRRRRVEVLRARLGGLVERQAGDVTWVDRTLAELSRLAGSQLPRPLRSFGRRVLEFSSHYDDLTPVAALCGMSRGALKARFRRRGLPSPSTYLRWFRMLATAHVLGDGRVTVAQAAARLGFTSDGNLCRAMKSLTGLTPSDVRGPAGRNRLLVGFGRSHLTPPALAAWESLRGLIRRRVA